MAASLKSADCWNYTIIRGNRVTLIFLGEFFQLSDTLSDKNQHYLTQICEKFGLCYLCLSHLDGRVGLTVRGPQSRLCHLWQSVPQSTQSVAVCVFIGFVRQKKQGFGLCLCSDAIWSLQARFMNVAT